MNLHDWADFAQLTLVPAILISLLGLWYNMHFARKQATEMRNGEWQKVVIYSMLDTKSLSFSEIRGELVAQATAYGLAEIGLERIRDISIKASLLELIAHNAILRIPPDNPGEPDRYMAIRARFEDPIKTARAMNEMMLARQRWVDSVILLVEQHNGSFTEAELAQFIKQSTKLDNEVVDNLTGILNSLEAQGLVGRSDNQKLFRARRMPPKVQRGVGQNA